MLATAAATELDPPKALNHKGFALVGNVLDAASVGHLRRVLDSDPASASLRRAGQTFGARNLLNLPDVRALAASRAVRSLVEPVIGVDAIPIRGLFFDKTAKANWPVLWHQDLTIAVASRHELPGWGPWSVKAGVIHVEPPPAVLAQMMTIRLHLDDCRADNGPLRVIPRSHRMGRLTRDAIAALRKAHDEQAVLAPEGAAILMRPLLLHASSPAVNPSHRRVIHIEFASTTLLPPPLTWATALPPPPCGEG